MLEDGAGCCRPSSQNRSQDLPSARTLQALFLRNLLLRPTCSRSRSRRSGGASRPSSTDWDGVPRKRPHRGDAKGVNVESRLVYRETRPMALP